jgi:hypothetical protein
MELVKSSRNAFPASWPQVRAWVVSWGRRGQAIDMNLIHEKLPCDINDES